MTTATGVGSLPGTTAAGYAEAVRLVLDGLPDLPHVPELPGRGVTAGMTGRALAITDGLAADLQPAGWRLTDASGVDHRRARSLRAQDLDAVEELAQGYEGTFKTQVAGPWTLAATVERPRGDRVLADHGARRELAQSLAEGVRAHVADVRRRLPGADVVVQVDAPALPAVLAGSVPTASGFSRHRSVAVPEATETLRWVLEAVAADAAPVVHCCADRAPLEVLTKAGARCRWTWPASGGGSTTTTPGWSTRVSACGWGSYPRPTPTRCLATPSWFAGSSGCWRTSTSTPRPPATGAWSRPPAAWPGPPRGGRGRRSGSPVRLPVMCPRKTAR